jgi:GT2 family glycosyltransferase
MRLPSFSIIVPTFDRPRELAACLESISHLDYPRDRLEVIVVDDGSPSPAAAIAEDAPRVRLERRDHAGPAAARNAGAGLASGDVLAFLDDDCRPEASWLRTVAETFASGSDPVVTGRTVNALEGNPFSAASQALIDFLYGHYNADAAHGRFFTSNNLAMSADLFRRIGGFDTSFPRAAAEDRDLCDRLVSAGHPIVYLPDAVIRHAHRLTFRSFLRQHFEYGCAALHYHRLRSRRQRGRIEVESPSFYLSLVRHAFRERRGAAAITTAGMLVLTQVANALGLLWGAGASNPRKRP